MLSITVKTLDGHDRKFSVENDSDVDAFKKHIAEAVQIPVESQRLIFHGKVLKDNDKLSDLNVDGKVVHLVERAPPVSGGRRNDNPGEQVAAPMDTDQIERAVRRTLDRLGDLARFVQVRSNPFPDGSGIEITVDIENNHEGPARGRLNHARHVLRHVQHVLHHVEQAQRRIDGASSDSNLQRRTNETIPKPDSIAENVASQPECVDLDSTIEDDMEDSYLLQEGVEEVAREGAMATNVNSSSAANLATNGQSPVANLTSNSSHSTLQDGNSGTVGSDNSSQEPSRPQPTQEVSVAELADALDDVLRVQDRLRPHIARYQALLREDPNFEGRVQEGRHAARFFNSIQLIMHNMAHIHHALSDMSVHFCESAPRHLYPVLSNNSQQRSSMVLTFRNTIDHGVSPFESASNAAGRSSSVPRRPTATSSEQSTNAHLRPALASLTLRPSAGVDGADGPGGATATISGFSMSSQPVDARNEAAMSNNDGLPSGGATIVLNPNATIRVVTEPNGSMSGTMTSTSTTTIPTSSPDDGSNSNVAGSTSASFTSGSSDASDAHGPEANAVGANFFQQLMQGIAATTTSMTINNLGLGALMNNGGIATPQSRPGQPNASGSQPVTTQSGLGFNQTGPNSINPQNATGAGRGVPVMIPIQGPTNIRMTFGGMGGNAASNGHPAMFMGMGPAAAPGGGRVIMGNPGGTGGFAMGPFGMMAGPAGGVRTMPQPMRVTTQFVSANDPSGTAGTRETDHAGSGANQGNLGANNAHQHQRLVDDHVRQRHAAHHHHHHYDQGTDGAHNLNNTFEGSPAGMGTPARPMMQFGMMQMHPGPMGGGATPRGLATMVSQGGPPGSHPHYHHYPATSMFVGPHAPATSLPLITIDRYLPCGSRFFREVQNRGRRGPGGSGRSNRNRSRQPASVGADPPPTIPNSNPIHSPEGSDTHIAHHDHYGEPSGVASPPPPPPSTDEERPEGSHSTSAEGMPGVGGADRSGQASSDTVATNAAGLPFRRRSASAGQSEANPTTSTRESASSTAAWVETFENQLEQTIRHALQSMSMSGDGMGSVGMTMGNGMGVGMGRVGLMGMMPQGTPVGINVMGMPQMQPGGANVGMANGVAMPNEITQLLSGVANQVASESQTTVGQFMRQTGLADVGVDGPVSQLFLEILEGLSFADVVNLMNRSDTTALDRNLPQTRQLVSERLFGGRANPSQSEIRAEVHRIVFEDEDRMRQFVTPDIRPREPDIDIAASVLACEERMITDLILIIYGHRDISGTVGQALYNRTLRGFRQIAQLGAHCCANGLPDFQRVVENCLNGISASNDANVHEEIPAPLRSYIAATGHRQIANLAGGQQIEGLGEFVVRRPATSPSSNSVANGVSATLRSRVPSDQLSNDDDEFMDTVEQHSPTNTTHCALSNSQAPLAPMTSSRPITPPLDGDDDTSGEAGDVGRQSSKQTDPKLNTAPQTLGAISRRPAVTGVNATEPVTINNYQIQTETNIEEDDSDSDAWKTVFPSEWVQIIEQDLSKQSLAPPQLPFSDAYLSGIPSRKRKRLVEDREDAMCARTAPAAAIGHGLNQAVQSLGVQPITGASTEDVIQTIVGDLSTTSGVVNGVAVNGSGVLAGAVNSGGTRVVPALTVAFENEQRERFRKRLRDDPDYRPERFPNSEKYFLE